MRLVVVTNDYPPKPGGIQQYLANLVAAYSEPVLVLAPDEASIPSGNEVVRGPSGYLWPTPRVRSWIVEEARRFSADAVLFGAPYPLASLGPRVRSALHVPYGVIAHGAEVVMPAVAPGLRQLVAGPLRAADVRFAVSEFTAGKVEQMTGETVTYLGAGVDLDAFAPSPDGAHAVPVVGSVSRFVPRKRQRMVLEAVARLGRPAEVLLVGRGRKEGDLRKTAERLGVTARFVVDAPWADLPGLYRSMDVFCMPCASRWGGLEVEGLGLVFLEAAATGLPVLAGDSGGSTETIVPGKTGYVVRSVGDIVEGLTILLDEPARAAAMGAAGRRFVEGRYTWDLVADRLIAGFESANPGPTV
jgi:phosphatidyl-myo-inositol dimannoside synthase